MPTALVLSAGAMFAAWEIGVWRVLRERFQFDLIVGTSAGAWNGWGIALGNSPDDLERDWLNPETGRIMHAGLHRSGCLLADRLYVKARELFDRGRPLLPFGLTLAEVPRLRPRLFRGDEITWQHLAATCSIPLGFPPVRIGAQRFVDGGLLGALPLWAADAMGATRAIALNCLTNLPFRMTRRVVSPRPSPGLKVDMIQPRRPLGSLWSGVAWSERNVRRWIEQGSNDATRALTSITM